MRILPLAIASLALAIFSPTKADAAPPPPVYRGTDGAVYIWGPDAAPGLELYDFERPYSRNLRANRCGVVQVRPTNAQPEIGETVVVQGGQPVAIASLPTLPSAPRCRGNQLQPFQAESFRVGDRLYLVNLAPGVRYEVRFPDVPRRKLLQPNACGFYRLRNPPRRFGVSGQNYQLEQLPEALPQLCREGVVYTPETWQR